ncbi:MULTISPECIES: Rrf2 family transcriptional regulator [unclassified Bordetella]|uniref:Rrf2 family transcriptional regulator n=1 Tax=unclassified Bordetella TaxID=2630031 RepID=UPI0013253513|nr:MULTISPECIES: Rrf2 family transcriptional regulator [unclassified Bordetella]MVW72742.1 Rrf2 family transcriptional regulator [Bordetella sp. 15P40C-2]MVW79025.1 Rrf2 family transcriptional regulator [Bordetella sp. 02P26C-1]
MQLTRYTDFGLRVMMYLTQAGARETPVTITEITERFAVSRNHIVKVVHFLGQQGWVATTRGKGGGLRLARPPSTYRLGDLVRTLEHQSMLVNCAEPPCALAGMCRLAGVLADSLQVFFDTLNQHTLADLVRAPTGEAIVQLYRSPY